MNRRVTHLRFDVVLVDIEYGMEYEVLYGVSDVIQDVTRRSRIVQRIGFI